jgi:hypothetical protein
MQTKIVVVNVIAEANTGVQGILQKEINKAIGSVGSGWKRTSTDVQIATSKGSVIYLYTFFFEKM